ncbi:MAG TPA: hypothetical protein VI461_12195, partial [Chitinophagaceae bacterium]|nr:hypothetical protein [Chitinophagaceae bacterium]
GFPWLAKGLNFARAEFFEATTEKKLKSFNQVSSKSGVSTVPPDSYRDGGSTSILRPLQLGVD